MAPNTARPLDRPATYADLEALPGDVRGEIFDGVIETQPRPLPAHSDAAGELKHYLRPLHKGGGGKPPSWWIFQDIDVRLPNRDVVGPDLVGWRRERLTDPWGVQPIEVLPDWICEVVSPTPKSRRRDRVKKRAKYAENGVAYYWLLDPTDRTLEALELRDDGSWREIGVFDDTAVVRCAPFEETELDVGALFPPSGDADAEG